MFLRRLELAEAHVALLHSRLPVGRRDRRKSLPPTLFALALACSIPSFEDLVGILTGVTIVSAGTCAVTLPWALGDYDDGRSHGVLHVATAVGLPLSAYIVAASLYFATTIPYSSDFFCDG